MPAPSALIRRSLLSQVYPLKPLRTMATAASEKQLIPLKIDVTSDTICPFCFIGETFARH